MELHHSNDGDVSILALKGQFETFRLSGFSGTVEGLIESGVRQVCLNLRARFNLDKIVDGATGRALGSSNHALMTGAPSALRDGALNPNLAGPLGYTMIQRLTNPDPAVGIILDSWFDANGDPVGGAPGAPVPQKD